MLLGHSRAEGRQDSLAGNKTAQFPEEGKQWICHNLSFRCRGSKEVSSAAAEPSKEATATRSPFSRSLLLYLGGESLVGFPVSRDTTHRAISVRIPVIEMSSIFQTVARHWHRCHPFVTYRACVRSSQAAATGGKPERCSENSCEENESRRLNGGLCGVSCFHWVGRFIAFLRELTPQRKQIFVKNMKYLSAKLGGLQVTIATTGDKNDAASKMLYSRTTRYKRWVGLPTSGSLT